MKKIKMLKVKGLFIFIFAPGGRKIRASGPVLGCSAHSGRCDMKEGSGKGETPARSHRYTPRKPKITLTRSPTILPTLPPLSPSFLFPFYLYSVPNHF
jgi:hypothetical protein